MIMPRSIATAPPNDPTDEVSAPMSFWVSTQVPSLLRLNRYAAPLPDHDDVSCNGDIASECPTTEESDARSVARRTNLPLAASS